MVLGFWDLDVPIVGAPMAGGPGTPALAAAVSNAGGLGFLAGGYISPDRLANDIAAARAATTGPIGVNLFVPQPSVADMHQLDYYAEALDELAEHYDVEIGYPNSATTTAGSRSSRCWPTSGPNWCRSPSAPRRRMCCAGSAHWECCSSSR